MTAFPKTQYVRSRKLLKAVASLPCMHCGAHGNTQAAHSNQSAHGKGRGIKASDIYTAAMCCACHYHIDQGTGYSKAERIEIWTTAWRATVRELLRRGEWPKEVPVPDIRLFH
jgi:hypothetical protein